MGAHPEPTPPRYGSACLSDVTPAILANLGVPDFDDALGLETARHVVLLVLDGLGWRQLREHERIATFLARQPEGSWIDTVFPSTTVAALTSVGTGLPPGRHGLVGYTVALPHLDGPLNLLTWAVGPYHQATGVLRQLPPEELQPLATAFERAEGAGVSVHVVGEAEFEGTGLTRAGLRGGRYAGAQGLEGVLAAAVEGLKGASRGFAYAYYGALDTIGHNQGPDSMQWRGVLGAIDEILERMVSRLPDDITLVITSDHGMVTIPSDGWVELADSPDLLAGVRVVAGEPRARQLHAREGAASSVLAAWRDRVGERFWVRSREDAIAAGWFGPEVTDAARERIGDVVAAAREGVAAVHRDIDPYGGRLAGMHGSLTRPELEVPLIVFNGGWRHTPASERLNG